MCLLTWFLFKRKIVINTRNVRVCKNRLFSSFLCLYLFLFVFLPIDFFSEKTHRITKVSSNALVSPHIHGRNHHQTRRELLLSSSPQHLLFRSHHHFPLLLPLGIFILLLPLLSVYSKSFQVLSCFGWESRLLFL